MVEIIFKLCMWDIDAVAANTLIDIQEFCNGAQIYLDQYDVTPGNSVLGMWFEWRNLEPSMWLNQA